MENKEMNVAMNPKLQDKFNTVCEDLGMDPQEAINIFAQKMVNEQAVPFEINENDYPVDEDEKKKEMIVKIFKVTGIVSAIVLVSTLIGKLIVHLAKKEIRKEETKLFFWK